MRKFASLSPNLGGGLRGIYNTSNGRLFGAWGDTLFEIDNLGVETDRNSNLRFTNSSGVVSFLDNGDQLIILETGEGAFILTLSSNEIVSITDDVLRKYFKD